MHSTFRASVGIGARGGARTPRNPSADKDEAVDRCKADASIDEVGRHRRLEILRYGRATATNMWETPLTSARQSSGTCRTRPLRRTQLASPRLRAVHHQRAEFQKKLVPLRLSPTNELKGTCWVKGGRPRAGHAAAASWTLKREDRSVTLLLEAVKVEGARGPRSKKDVLAEKKAKKDSKLTARRRCAFDTPVDFEGDWTKKEGKWVVPKEDREDFRTDGPLIGTKVWRNVARHGARGRGHRRRRITYTRGRRGQGRMRARCV